MSSIVNVIKHPGYETFEAFEYDKVQFMQYFKGYLHVYFFNVDIKVEMDVENALLIVQDWKEYRDGQQVE